MTGTTSEPSDQTDAGKSRFSRFLPVVRWGLAIWVVGIVVPTVAQFSSDQSRVAQTRAQVVQAVANATLPLVGKASKLTEPGQSGQPQIESALHAALPTAAFRASLSVYTSLPGSLTSLNNWLTLVAQYAELTQGTAICRHEQALKKGFTPGLVANVRKDYEQLGSSAPAYLANSRKPRWRSVYCTNESNWWPLLGVGLRPNLHDYEYTFVTSALSSRPRGGITTRMQLIEHVIWPI